MHSVFAACTTGAPRLASPACRRLCSTSSLTRAWQCMKSDVDRDGQVSVAPQVNLHLQHQRRGGAVIMRALLLVGGTAGDECAEGGQAQAGLTHAAAWCHGCMHGGLCTPGGPHFGLALAAQEPGDLMAEQSACQQHAQKRDCGRGKNGVWEENVGSAHPAAAACRLQRPCATACTAGTRAAHRAQGRCMPCMPACAAAT